LEDKITVTVSQSTQAWQTVLYLRSAVQNLGDRLMDKLVQSEPGKKLDLRERGGIKVLNVKMEMLIEFSQRQADTADKNWTTVRDWNQTALINIINLVEKMGLKL
jgi:hypothetical protein